MKKLFATFIMIALMGTLVGCSTSNAQGTDTGKVETTEVFVDEEVTLGGWTTNQSDKLTKEEKAVLEKALDGLVGATYKPVRLLATQTVAGTNYAFLCKTTVVYPGAEPTYTIVYVYEDLDGNVEITNVEDLVAQSGEEVTGGWTASVSEEQAKAGEAALEKATEEMEGATYEPVAVVGTQVVAGTNYEIICLVTPVYPDAEGSYARVTVYEDLEGNAEITNVEDIEYTAEAAE